MKKVVSFFTAVVMAFTMAGSTFADELDSGVMTENLNENVEVSDYSVKSDNSFGTLFADALNTELDNQTINTDYSVLGISINGNQGEISYSAMYDCQAVVGIYDEETDELITSASTELQYGSSTASVTFNADEMPEYFVAKVFIIDPETMRPLNKAYESTEYTEAMVKLREITIDDFEDCVVVNFDNNNSSNFVAFDSDVNVFYENYTLTETQHDNGSSDIVIETADNGIKSLKSGDKFAFMGKDSFSGSALGVVDTITVSGDTVNIISCSMNNYDLDDFFSCVKLGSITENTSAENLSAADEMEVLGDSAADEMEVLGDKEISMTVKVDGNEVSASYNTDKRQLKLSYTHKLETANKVVTGSLGIVLAAKFSGYDSKNDEPEFIKFGDEKWFGKEILSVKVNVHYSAELTASVTLSTPEALRDLKIIIPIPLAGPIKLEVGIKLSFNPKVSLVGKYTIEGNVGFEYDFKNKNGIPLNSDPIISSICYVEGSVSVGVTVNIDVAFINSYVLSIGNEYSATFTMSGKYDITGSSTDIPEEKHACKKCIDGSTKIVHKLTSRVKLADSEAEISPASTITKDGPPWYCSFDYSCNGCNYEGAFGMKCPHKVYRVKVNIVDYFTGQPIKNAKLTYTDKLYSTTGRTETISTDENGVAIFYACGPDEGKKHNRVSYSVEAPYYVPHSNLAISVHANAEEATVQLTPAESNWAMVRQIENNGDSSDNCWGLSKSYKLYNISDTAELFTGFDYDKDIIVDIMPYMNGNDKCCAVLTFSGDVYMCEPGNKCTLVHTNASKLLRKDGAVYVVSSDNNIYPLKSKVASYYDAVDFAYRARNYDCRLSSDGIIYMKNLTTNNTISSAGKPKFKSIDCCGEVYAAVTVDGDLYTFGYSNCGALGLGTNVTYSSIQKVDLNGQKVSKVILKKYVYANKIYVSMMILTENGDLYATGYSSYGELGTGSVGETFAPKKVLTGVRDFCLSNKFSVAITKTDKIYFSGYSWYADCKYFEEYKLSDNSFTDVSEVIADKYYSYILRKNGTLYEVLTNNKGARLIPCPEDTDAVSVVNSSDVAALGEVLGATNTSKTSETKSYTGLMPNTVYNVYAMRSKNADDPFGNENLLYINQFTADENGELTFEYEYPTDAVHTVVIKAMTDIDYGNAKITSAEPGTNSVTLSWEQFPNAAKYKVYCYKGACPVAMYETTDLSYTFNGLDEGTSYRFIVSCCIYGEWSEYDAGDCVYTMTGERDFFDGWDEEDYINYVNSITETDEDTIILDQNQLEAIEHVLEADYGKTA